MKHTKGPWTCHSGAVYQDSPDVYPKGETNGIPIAHMDRESGNGTAPVERDANAHLIAAAPDLLAACKEFLRKVDCNQARSVRSYAEMKAAIAKAEHE